MNLPPALRESSGEGGQRAPVHPALRRILAALIGDARQVSLNRRLFNSVSLLNAITNIGGVPSLLLLKDPGRLVALNLGTGLIFLGFYGFSRFVGRYRPLYWPFVLTILTFLFANMLFNAGASGGAVWYLIPALVIATALAPRTGDAVASGLLFSAAALAILLIERRWPDLIHPYASERDRLTDLAGNLVFALLFTGSLVFLLARTLNAERHRSDALLLNVLPREIAEELKRNSRVVPAHYDSATVLFSDFVGFTRVAELLTPSELVDQLDRIFQEFDAISQAHGLEKIKTIGDAYLAVGGIPRPRATHAIDGALAALEMLRASERIRVLREQAGLPAWSIRLGLNTGPLIAGVVGTEKFAYDVWGDTVNTASRIESSGIPGQINLSAATFDQVKEFFDCEPRGRVAAKGKGELDMYLLKSIRSEYSEDGVTPNHRFRERYLGLQHPSAQDPSPSPVSWDPE
ncbi:MAG: adenylate/guanylate cyclase domain-containing protein [Verrucomicrobiales bacterium]|nr:adenylate/guanylate cyclase domain-containing protein [Verrucomicrobiales bacterium]